MEPQSAKIVLKGSNVGMESVFHRAVCKTLTGITPALTSLSSGVLLSERVYFYLSTFSHAFRTEEFETEDCVVLRAF